MDIHILTGLHGSIEGPLNFNRPSLAGVIILGVLDVDFIPDIQL